MANRVALVAGALSGAVFLWAAMSPTAWQGAPGEDYNSGAYLYRAFCASCHGDGGRGDGPVADLAARPPTDLTSLTQRTGGVFPRARVMSALDGTMKLEGHEPPAMPNWARVLRKTADDDERVVRKRLEALVSHVESLQQRN
jgi:mono/diheme cytochrome c family protein